MRNWQVVEVKPRKSRNASFVSIGRGQIDINAMACSLVNDEGQYNYAKILRDGEVIGIQFITGHEPNSLKITRKSKTANGTMIKGMTIRNKEVIQEVFGNIGIKDDISRFQAEKDPESNNVLLIRFKKL